MTVPSLQKMFDIVHIAVTELSAGGKVSLPLSLSPTLF